MNSTCPWELPIALRPDTRPLHGNALALRICRAARPVHGKGGDLPSVLTLIEEAPFHTRVGVTPAARLRLCAAVQHDIRNLCGELDALTNPVIHIELRELPD